jgi:hypothetical protein
MLRKADPLQDLARYDRLIKMRERETKLMGLLATKLRMCPHARYSPTTANTALTKPQQPWGSTVK